MALNVNSRIKDISQEDAKIRLKELLRQVSGR